MKFFAGVKYQLTPYRCYRPFLCLRAQDSTWNFEAMQGSGAFINIVNRKLKGADWEAAREKAESHLGSLQPINTIEIEADDLSRLARHYVNSNEVHGPVGY